MTEISDLNLARQRLSTTDMRLVLVRDEKIVAGGDRPGVIDLWELYRENPQILKEAAAADRVVGRAAAFIMAAGGAAACYGQIMSRGAEAVLRRAGIIYEADIEVEAIKNAAGDDLCPLEKLTAGVEEPQEALDLLADFLADRD